jgi:hypothetical protein
MLTPNAPWRAISGHEEAARLMPTISDGGSTDSDDTEVHRHPRDVLAPAGRDDADTTGEMAHRAAEIGSRNR